MSKKLRLHIITPDKNMFDDEVDSVIMRGVDGDFGILAGHTPFATVLGYGKMRIVNEGREREASMLGGFVEVHNDIITVLSDAAEWSDEIDVKRAEAALQRAERDLKNAKSTLEVNRAALQLRRAHVRIDVSSYSMAKHK